MLTHMNRFIEKMEKKVNIIWTNSLNVCWFPFQDTVLGLQAMSEYGAIMTGNLDMNIDVISGNFTQNIHIGKSDAMVLKLIEVVYDLCV